MNVSVIGGNKERRQSSNGGFPLLTLAFSLVLFMSSTIWPVSASLLRSLLEERTVTPGRPPSLGKGLGGPRGKPTTKHSPHTHGYRLQSCGTRNTDLKAPNLQEMRNVLVKKIVKENVTLQVPECQIARAQIMNCLSQYTLKYGEMQPGAGLGGTPGHYWSLCSALPAHHLWNGSIQEGTENLCSRCQHCGVATTCNTGILPLDAAHC